MPLPGRMENHPRKRAKGRPRSTVAKQVEELGCVGRLKRFLAPQLAELIPS
jgi:hypothetical protein